MNFAEETSALIWGLTVTDWSILLGALASLVGAIHERIRANKGENKLKAVVEAVEETATENPEAVNAVKRLAKHKATRLGVQTGLFGLDRDVKKLTKRFDKSKLEEI